MTVQDVLTSCNTKGALYHYFDSRALLDGIVGR